MSAAGPAVRSILLVEDSVPIRGAFRVLLEDCGYAVTEAGSGEEALRLARKTSPTLVLLDLGLPDIDGLEVARRLRSTESVSAVPIIALTGRTLEADAQACRAAGCTTHLTKPIDSARLLEEIAALVSAADDT